MFISKGCLLAILENLSALNKVAEKWRDLEKRIARLEGQVQGQPIQKKEDRRILESEECKEVIPRIPEIVIKTDGTISELFVDGKKLEGVTNYYFTHDKRENNTLPKLLIELKATNITLDAKMLPTLPEPFSGHFVSISSLLNSKVVSKKAAADICRENGINLETSEITRNASGVRISQGLKWEEFISLKSGQTVKAIRFNEYEIDKFIETISGEAEEIAILFSSGRRHIELLFPFGDTKKLIVNPGDYLVMGSEIPETMPILHEFYVVNKQKFLKEHRYKYNWE